MSPKIPRKPPLSSSQQPDPVSLHHQHVAPGVPPAYRLPGFAHPSDPARPTGTHSTSQSITPPSVVIHAMPTQNPAHLANDGSVESYWLSDEFLVGMRPADDNGFRWIVGRQFVDVEYASGLQTTHVGLDDTGHYRSKTLFERVPSGPRLYKNEGQATWRLTERPSGPALSTKRPALPTAEHSGLAPVAKRPRPAPAYLNQSQYAATPRSPDPQGYYELKPSLDRHSTDIQFAFRDPFGNWVQVDPPAAGFGAQHALLKHWTDHDIWQTYGIHGQEIVRFRAEAQALGKPPQWVESVATDNPLTDLLDDSLRWLHPDMNLQQRETLLQSYNLLPSQLTRLRDDLLTELAIPQWAQKHKQLTEDLDNPQRLEQLSRDVSEELNLKRGAQHDWYSPKASMTPEVLEALLNKLGYQRNQNNCLYRTDVPALFRGDDRTPFELANDEAMLPRYHHEPGATTHKPMSATFSLNEGQVYARAPDPEYLRFNSQTNKHPGGDVDGQAPDSDASDTPGTSSSEWSEATSPIPWDHDRHYESTRTRQTVMFMYALDTRHLEVVPHEENIRFNSAARDTSATWFPSDDFEGLISVTRSGLNADRVWLLNTALTKGVKVDDIRYQAGDRAERIEAATHAGHTNKFEYDLLIDQAEDAGKPVLRLSGNGNEFAYDITWPETDKPTTQGQ
ncbi:hypothetical protein [Pseudomonas sp. IT-P395]|uniref:hypothetical protein n=1 Tax=Pseudomonas sp. IT-P395 TaxID=3026459 RepID=UPI0039E1307C